MKKIAYIELDTHAEVASSFYDLFRGSDLFQVDYYLSKKVNNRFEGSSEDIIISDVSLVLDQLANKAYDLVVVGTAHRFFNTFLEITRRFPTVIITHNLNFSEATKNQLLQSIFKKDTFFRLKLLLKESLLSAPFLYQNHHRLVLDKDLERDKVIGFNLFYNQKTPISSSSEELCVVIPGAASQQRRDYYHVLERLETTSRVIPINVVFLGKADRDVEERIKNSIHNLSKKITITSFKEKVSSEEFDFWMQKADVLWCPIQKETEFLGVKEYYGSTKMTGNIGDAIKYGKWAVFPKDYSCQLQNVVKEEEDVVGQFIQLKARTLTQFSGFSKDNALADAESILLKLMS